MVSDWVTDALVAVDQLIQGPVLLVGSSQGGWISTHVASVRPQRVVGLIVIGKKLQRCLSFFLLSF